jgi:hypothetical protein
MVKVTGAGGGFKTETLTVSVTANGRRRLLSESEDHEETDRMLHINASPDPAVRVLLAEAKGVLGGTPVQAECT